MTALAGMAGGMVVTGLILLIRELTRRGPAPGTPSRTGFRLDMQTRKRLLFAGIAGLAVLAVTRWPVAMIAAALAVLFLPAITSSKAARQRAVVLEGLEQWARRLSDMLSASRGLEDALEASAPQAPAAIEPAVTALGRRLSARAGTEAALRAFADEIDDPAGDRIAAALIIATGRRGGAVRDVLNSLAVMLSRDIAARREIEADRAQHRTTVRWLSLFVLGLTVFAVLNRAYSAPYGTVPGQIVMALVVALYAGGLWWLHHLGSVPAPGRFLASEQPGDRRLNAGEASASHSGGTQPDASRLTAGRLTATGGWADGGWADGGWANAGWDNSQQAKGGADGGLPGPWRRM